MMKRIKPEELPEILTKEVIDILAQMAHEFPKRTFDWAEISEILESRGQSRLVLDRVEEIQKAKEAAKRSAMSEEEKAEEAAKWERIKNDPDPRFYGNMGEPETKEEYKRKYGHYPPGIDKDGNKI